MVRLSTNHWRYTRQLSLGLAVLLLLLGLGASVAYGAAEISISNILTAITSFDDSTEHLIIRTMRLPRSLLAMMVGASLAVAGALMQGLTQNPLASPGILGINAGSALAVVLVVFGLGETSPPLIALVALIGAFVAAIAVYFIASLGQGGATSLNLTVTGSVVTALLSSLTTGVLIKSERTLEEVRFWLAGSVASRDFDLFLTVLPLMVVGLLTALALGRQINVVSDIVRAVIGLKTQDPESPFVVVILRLPRILISWLVGVGLALSGAILQGLTRNPLADPGIIGVNAGAGLAVVSLIVLFPDALPAMLPLAAFSGAFFVALLIYLLAGTGEKSPLRLVLVGVALGAIAAAITTFILTFGKINHVSQALVWLAGSVSGKSWEQVWSLLPWLVVFGSLALGLARELNVLQLGNFVVIALGSRVAWQRTKLLLVSVALAGASVAAGGTIGFVGLMAPHLARQLVGPMYEELMPIAALIGGLLVAGADLLGRTLFAPTEMPCGLLTATLGAPYFLYLLYRGRKV